MIAPRGYINIENKGVSIVRVTGVVWNVPAKDVFIHVGGEVISSKVKKFDNGQIEVTGVFYAIEGEIIDIDLIYQRNNGTEYQVLANVPYSLRASFS